MNFSNLLVNGGLAFANVGARYDPTGIAQKLLDGYAKRREEAKLRAELEALSAARFDQFREQLVDAMGDHQLQMSEGAGAQVEAYVSQFRACA